MKKQDYLYHLCLPTEKTVEVRFWNPTSQSTNEATGIFRLQKLEQIREIFIDPSTLQSDDIRKAGEALFDALFDEQLRQDFLKIYRQIVLEEQQPLHIILKINEIALPAIAAYPWELMRLPQRYNQGTIQFATDSNLRFFRSQYGLQNTDKLSIRLKNNEKLKIALVIARPTADDRLNQVEYQSIENELKNLVSDPGKIELLPVINPATQSKIIEQLRNGKPDIWHFIGHGQFNAEAREQGGEIALVNDFGAANWINADFLGQLLTQHRPKVVILQACETATRSPAKAFSSIASRLLLQNIPAAIAMQYKVSNDTASKFVRNFYQEIVAGSSLEMAVQQARFKIAIAQGYDRLDSAIPVLYSNAVDGYFWADEMPDSRSAEKSIEWTDELKVYLREEIEKFLSRDKLEGIFIENESKFGKNFDSQISGSSYRDRVTRTIRELDNRGLLDSFITVVRQEYPLFAKKLK